MPDCDITCGYVIATIVPQPHHLSHIGGIRNDNENGNDLSTLRQGFGLDSRRDSRAAAGKPQRGKITGGKQQ